MKAAAVLALMLAALPASSRAAPGGEAEAPAPSGEPMPASPLRDPQFGVSTRRPGLQRQVEMYQWRRTAEGYVREWSVGLIDSQGYDAAHRNPPNIPLPSRTWWSSDVRLDGRPLDDAVLRTLGEWRTFRPGFSRLPGNMAATFQPDGDGLNSAENPLRPEIGDLRVTWKALHLPPLENRVVLRGGVWTLSQEAAASVPQIDVPVSEPGAPAGAPAARPRWGLYAVLAVTGVLAMGLLLRRRRARRRPR